MESKRPLAVTIVACLLIVGGTAALISGLWSWFSGHKESSLELIVASGIRALALVAGVFMLRAKNWARWLCIAWFGYHVVLSIWHSAFELLMHSLFLIVVSFLLFRPKSSAYFSR